MQRRRATQAVVTAAAIAAFAGLASSTHAAPVEPPAPPDATRSEAAKLRPFRGEVSELSAKDRKRMKGKSWHEGCPVGLGELRELSVSLSLIHI